MNQKYEDNLRRATEAEAIRAAYEDEDIDIAVAALRREIERIRLDYQRAIAPIVDQIVRLEQTRRVGGTLLSCVKCKTFGPFVGSNQSRIDGWMCPMCYTIEQGKES